MSLEEANTETDTQKAEPAAAPPQCTVCKNVSGEGSGRLSDGRSICALCRNKIQGELDSQALTTASIPRALVGGFMGAFLGAAVWAAVTSATNMEIGYLAVLIGFLVGKGILLAVGNARGLALQYIGAVCAVIGLFLAKYILFAIAVDAVFAKQGLEKVNHLSTQMFSLFFHNIGSLLNGYDLLWVFLAVGIAYKMPRPTVLSITPVHG